MRRFPLVSILVLLASTLPACGGNSEPDPVEADAGGTSPADATVPGPDAGIDAALYFPDGSIPSDDAGLENPDGSVEPDAGPTGDAGSMGDAGHGQDAGQLEPDGGVAARPVTVWDLKSAESPNHPAAGEAVVVSEAVITAAAFADGPGRRALFAADAQGGPWRGVEVRALAQPTLDALVPGARVRVEGRVLEEDGKRLLEASALTLGTLGEPLLPSAATEAGALAAAAWEGVLVELSGVTVTRDDLGESAFEVDGALRVEDRIFLYGAAPAGGTRFGTLRGVVSLEAAGFALLPRSAEDMVSTCSPGAVGCAGSDRTSCGNDGLWQVVESCAGGCVAGACTACQPGDGDCDGANRRTCSPQGSWRLAETCETLCFEGACTPCAPGARRCAGSAVERCSAQGAWELEHTCSVGCFEGACTQCVPGAWDCYERQLYFCEPDGQFVESEYCAGDCTPGACVPCASGTFGCANPSQRAECVDGVWGEPSWCSGVCVGGECVDCEPGQTTCDGQTVLACDQAGSWQQAETCATAEICLWGECLVPECTTGERRCQSDATGSWVEECFGRWGYFQSCDAAATCLAGFCEGNECAGNDFACIGHEWAMCDGHGNLIGMASCAGTDESWCHADLGCGCRPGARRCGNPMTVQECGGDGTWSNVVSCSGSESCTEGVCTSGVYEPVFTLGGLTWHQPTLVSGLPPHRRWDEAVAYCSNLVWAGFGDWRLPTVSELRRLVHGCAATETGGACGVEAGCAETICDGAECNGCTANLGPCGGRYLDPDLVRSCTATSLWSITPVTDAPDFAWTLGTATGEIGPVAKTGSWEHWCVR